MRGNIYSTIQQYLKQFDYFDSIYLFGSILDITKAPNDIDILLIYSEHSKNIVCDVKSIRYVLSNISGLPIDLTVLGIEEERQIQFISRLNLKYLRLR